MKHNIKTYFALPALFFAGMGALTSCMGDDDFGRIPEGGIPLSIGQVAVAGVETAGGNTRAATTEDASGFTGIRKTTFVNDDALSLVLSDDGGTTTTTVTATLTGGQWVLNPAKNFVIPGTTTIKATYSPTATSGMKADNLEAATYTLDGQKVTFDMKHVNALLDITYTASVAPASMTVTANNGTADETLSTALEEEADGTKHFRAIASPGTVKSLTAVINGKNYIAALATPLTVEANKRYPIALTFKENALTATVGTATLNWSMGGTGGLFASGYDYYIGTPEDLAQFAYDVNNNLNGARTAKVLQTADIDLAQLKTAADANTANPGKSYTYTATADNWVPIAESDSRGGSFSIGFYGTYNGNGYTINNMKITANSSTSAGFFGCVSGATLTSIHLRDVLINFPSGTGKDCASLCVYAYKTTISLCSATGNITYYGPGDQYTPASGGLIGVIEETVVTRCSCNVNIVGYNCELEAFDPAIGGFAGYAINGAVVAGCSYKGNIIRETNGGAVSYMIGGFLGYIYSSMVFGCSCSGTLESDGECGSFYGEMNGSDITMVSCYSTMTGENIGFGKYSSNTTYTDCAYTGTQSAAIAGVTGDVALADLYDKITASSASSPAAIKTLHWSAADGYTTTEVSDTWHASGVWKDNKMAAPTVDMTYEGGAPMYNGKKSNLLAILGQTAYWVAPENAAAENWNPNDVDIICPEGWHVPTKEEFLAMTGIPSEDSESANNFAAISAVFPDNIYRSATPYDMVISYGLTVNSGTGKAVILREENRDMVTRCVRKK